MDIRRIRARLSYPLHIPRTCRWMERNYIYYCSCIFAPMSCHCHWDTVNSFLFFFHCCSSAAKQSPRFDAMSSSDAIKWNESTGRLLFFCSLLKNAGTFCIQLTDRNGICARKRRRQIAFFFCFIAIRLRKSPKRLQQRNINWRMSFGGGGGGGGSAHFPHCSLWLCDGKSICSYFTCVLSSSTVDECIITSVRKPHIVAAFPSGALRLKRNLFIHSFSFQQQSQVINLPLIWTSAAHKIIENVFFFRVAYLHFSSICCRSRASSSCGLRSGNAICDFSVI